MCLYPVNIFLPHNTYLGKHSAAVPCGKCDECLNDYQNFWAIRMSEEFIAKHYKGAFLTLTYREDAIPYYGMTLSNGDIWTNDYIEETGCVEDDLAKPYQLKNGKWVVPGNKLYTFDKVAVQKWIRRTRENLALKRSMKIFPDDPYNPDNLKQCRASFSYYLTSEYGCKGLRSHYHVLFFGLNCEELGDAIADWESRFGHVDFDDIRYNLSDGHTPGKIIYYVSKYCSKGSFENPRVKSGAVDKCFHLISHNFGKSYIIRRVSEIRSVLSNMLPSSGLFTDISDAYIRSNLDYTQHLVYSPRLRSLKRVNLSSVVPFFGLKYNWDCSADGDHFLRALNELLVYIPNEFVSERCGVRYALPRFFYNEILKQLSKSYGCYEYEIGIALQAYKENCSNALFVRQLSEIKSFKPGITDSQALSLFTKIERKNKIARYQACHDKLSRTYFRSQY